MQHFVRGVCALGHGLLRAAVSLDLEKLRSAPSCVRLLVTHGFRPFGIFTHLTVAERLVLFQLASRLPPQSVILEVGSYLGGSSTFLALGARANDSTVYCVDTWTNQAMSEGLRDTYSTFLHNIRPVADRIVPVRGPSVEVAGTFHHGISMLFIDGDHSYDGVFSDVTSWWPKLRGGAIVAFHDYTCSEGVRRVVNELVRPNVLSDRVVDSLYFAQLRPCTRERWGC